MLRPPDTVAVPAAVALPELSPAAINTGPPAAELLPTTILMAPPEPPAEVPDCSDMKPLFPETDLPVLNNKLPEAPADNTLLVVTTTDPEPELTLLPELTITDPPNVLVLDTPDDSIKAPAAPLSPLPTTMLTLPARPPVAVPL